jgi:DNA-directed RNA polymerase sigma subunit (sigma70/sigma32)
MRAAHTTADPDAVEAALRRLTPSAERLLRARFGIGATRARGQTPALSLPARRLRQLEASAFRTLRLNAISPQPT